MLEYIEESCPSGTSDLAKHICNKDIPSPMLWDPENANHRIDPETHDASTVFYAYGNGTNLRQYQAHIDDLSGAINTACESANVPVPQDPRCGYATSHLHDSDKYIFLNNNNLLSHPSGPKEPDRCYIPPQVSNVMYHEDLCAPTNELIFSAEFAAIVEVRGPDVHGVSDKDAGTPMCVLRFKNTRESGLTPEEHIAKLGQYM